MPSPVPHLVDKMRMGDDSALDQLVCILYDELRRIASRQLRAERTGHTLQPTALVHEAYLRLFDGAERQFADIEHFLAISSRVMRQVLVDHARARSTKKRGGGGLLSEALPVWQLGSIKDGQVFELMALDSALNQLEREDAALARLVEMHYFGGFTAQETAEALGLSVHSVRHDLRFAQAWLQKKLSPPKV